MPLYDKYYYFLIIEFDGRVNTQRHYPVLRLRTRKTESSLSKYPVFQTSGNDLYNIWNYFPISLYSLITKWNLISISKPLFSISDQSKHYLLQFNPTRGTFSQENNWAWLQLLLYSRSYGPSTPEPGFPWFQSRLVP